jgi:curved DNA-binding protein CbpA/Tfp pilus assembly protein PilF
VLRGDRIQPDDAPKPVAGVDLKALPIGPQEAFVMSRVDGQARAEQIALETGLDGPSVKNALHRLAELGAITLPGFSGSVTLAPSPEVPLQSSPRATGVPAPVAASEFVIIESTAEALAYDPAELDEPGDLGRERKQQILDVYYRLDTATHYELLNVDRSAERQEIKNAYYERVAIFHPDKYFGKDLGAFRVKVERVFQRLTVAHDVLSRKQSRAAYDTTLPAASRPPGGGSPASGSPPSARPREPSPSPGSVSTASSRPVSPTAPTEPPSRPPSPASPPGAPVAPDPGASGARRISRTPLPEEDRRKLLARHFASATPAPRPAPAPAPVPAPAEHAAHALRRHYESTIAGAGKAQLKRFLEQAAEAERTGDALGLVNLLKIATSLAPDDAALAERLQRTESALAIQLSGRYFDEGVDEERNGRFLDAAARFERALRGRPDDATLHDRTARCYLQGGKEHKRAAELARRAVDLAPDSVSYRITLARVYTAAGMLQSALTELDRARTLAPADGSIRQLIQRIRRGDA